MTLSGFKELRRMYKEKSTYKYKTDLFISANKLMAFNAAYKQDLLELGLPSNFPMEFANLSSTISLVKLSKRNERKDLGLVKGIVFDMEYLNVLNLQESRAMLWHEFGHIIYAHFFPENFKKGIKLYGEGPKYREIEEIFVDEFTYRKFGDVYRGAITKAIRYDGKKHKKSDKEITSAIKKNTEFIVNIKKYGYGYWKAEADKRGVNIKYNPSKTEIKSVKFKTSLLKGLYEV